MAQIWTFIPPFFCIAWVLLFSLIADAQAAVASDQAGRCDEVFQSARSTKGYDAADQRFTTATDGLGALRTTPLYPSAVRIGIWGDSHTASGSFMDAMLQAWGFPTEGMRAGHVQAAMDLGTGSGAIALAFKHQRPNVQMHARDLSADALDVARANAQRLDLEIAFSQGAWLEGFTETFDAIVSNPPYIAEADPHLLALRHEPVQALTSGADGLNDLRAIITQAPACLKPGGWLLLEHGYDQGEAVRQLLQAKGFVAVQSRKDLAGIERCSGGRCAARTDI